MGASFLTLACGVHGKRKIESLDLLEAHSFFLTNGDGLDTSVHRQPRMLSRSREANSRLHKKSLTVPEQAELVSAKGACE